MTVTKAKQIQIVFNAFANGETVQYQNDDGTWQDATNLDFSDDAKCYRLKPLPRERWVINGREFLTYEGADTYRCRLDNDNLGVLGYHTPEIVHYREVMK